MWLNMWLIPCFSLSIVSSVFEKCGEVTDIGHKKHRSSTLLCNDTCSYVSILMETLSHHYQLVFPACSLTVDFCILTNSFELCFADFWEFHRASGLLWGQCGRDKMPSVELRIPVGGLFCNWAGVLLISHFGLPVTILFEQRISWENKFVND